MFDIDDTPAVSREELARKAVLEHYTGAAGGQGRQRRHERGWGL